MSLCVLLSHTKGFEYMEEVFVILESEVSIDISMPRMITQLYHRIGIIFLSWCSRHIMFVTSSRCCLQHKSTSYDYRDVPEYLGQRSEFRHRHGDIHIWCHVYCKRYTLSIFFQITLMVILLHSVDLSMNVQIDWPNPSKLIPLQLCPGHLWLHFT